MPFIRRKHHALRDTVLSGTATTTTVPERDRYEGPLVRDTLFGGAALGEACPRRGRRKDKSPPLPGLGRKVHGTTKQAAATVTGDAAKKRAGRFQRTASSAYIRCTRPKFRRGMGNKVKGTLKQVIGA